MSTPHPPSIQTIIKRSMTKRSLRRRAVHTYACLSQGASIIRASNRAYRFAGASIRRPYTHASMPSYYARRHKSIRRFCTVQSTRDVWIVRGVGSLIRQVAFCQVTHPQVVEHCLSSAQQIITSVHTFPGWRGYECSLPPCRREVSSLSLPDGRGRSICLALAAQTNLTSLCSVPQQLIC